MTEEKGIQKSVPRLIKSAVDEDGFMTNEQLVIRIKAGIDTADNMAQLWQQNRAFIHSMAWRYRGYAEMDDLEQEGFLGLCRAVEKYDSDKGVQFLSYAGHWIKQSMVRYAMGNGTVRIPEYNQNAIRKYKKLVSDFEKEIGRKPTRPEICYYLGLSDEEYQQLLQDASIDQLQSLDSPIEGTEGLTVGDLAADTRDVEEEILSDRQEQQLKEILWSLVDDLPEMQSEVIRMRFQKGLTLQSAGDILGITKERVRQEEAKSLRSLRKWEVVERIRPFLYDYIDCQAHKGTGVESFNRTWTSSTERVALYLTERKNSNG